MRRIDPELFSCGGEERDIPSVRIWRCVAEKGGDPAAVGKIGDGTKKTGVKGGKFSGAKGSGMASLSRKIPAELSKEQEEEIYSLAKKTFTELNCEGISRIDFIIDKDTNNVYVNEINTIPGSLAFYLWEPKGISFSELLDRAIRYAIKRKERRDKIVYSTDVNILNMTGKK